VSPSGSDGYDFRDLVSLRIVRRLLDAGLSSQRVGVALRALREEGADLAGLRLVTDGSTVWVCHDDGQILDALRAGQLALFVAVDQVAADVEADVHAFTQERDEFLDHLRDTGSS
jgi:DNA-binding transcriptional MerR regulator